MKRGTPEHPKMRHLAELLGIPLPFAVGIMEMLWHFTAKYAPQGDIGRFSDEVIAKAVGWQRPTGARGVTPECKLSDALVTSKWVDRDSAHRLIVHDWNIHADQAVTKMLSRHGISFVRTRDSLPEPVPEPVPVPVPHTHTARARVTSETLKPRALSPGVLTEVCAFDDYMQKRQPARPIASDLNGHSPQRFAEWWAKYPLQDDRDSAARMYLSVVTADTEAAALACLDRYLLSDRVSRGVVVAAWKWLEQQHRNNWAGDWPVARHPPKRGKSIDELVEEMNAEERASS